MNVLRKDRLNMPRLKSILLLLLLCTCAVWSKAQRELRPLYDLNEWQKRGWFFAPGVTFMQPAERNRDEVRFLRRQGFNDTLHAGTFSNRSRVGLYFEVGRHHFTDKIYFVDHIDYGIHVKMLRGTERFDGRVKVGFDLPEFNNSGRFSETFAGAFFNASNIARISSNLWWHSSVGVNAEYRIISRRSYDGPTLGMSMDYPRPYLGQLHFKAGLGWKADPGLYFMPMIETPILSLLPFDDGKSTLQYFTGRYRPIILTVRVMLLDRRKGRECENQPGKPLTKEELEKSGMKHKGNDLFGDDVNARKLKKRKSRGKTKKD